MSDATRVPDEWVEAALAAYGPACLRALTTDHHTGEPTVDAEPAIRETVAAVAPLIRRAVAEEIAGDLLARCPRTDDGGEPCGRCHMSAAWVRTYPEAP